MNIMELDTLFASVANLVNQRPLGIRSRGEDDLRSITPNDLLLGRSRQVLKNMGQFGDSDDLEKRVKLVKDLEEAFFSKYF